MSCCGFDGIVAVTVFAPVLVTSAQNHWIDTVALPSLTSDPGTAVYVCPSVSATDAVPVARFHATPTMIFDPIVGFVGIARATVVPAVPTWVPTGVWTRPQAMI
jgi:hypothetical protein